MWENLRKLFGRRAFHTAALTFLAVCVLIAVAMFGYYSRLQRTVINETDSYMREISRQIGLNVNGTINENFSVLNGVAIVIKSPYIDTYEKLRPIVQEQRLHWGYQDIYIIDESGNARTANGDTVNLGGGEYLRTAVVNHKQAMSTAQVVDGEECIVFIIPVEGLSLDGDEFVALAASYRVADFENILNMTAFDGKAYCTLNQRDGSVIVRSDSDDNRTGGYNTLNTLEASAKMDKGGSLEAVRTDLAQGRSGMVGFTMDGVHTYLSYTPLETGPWCLMTFVPVSVVNAQSQTLLSITLAMCGLIVLAFVLLLGALMLLSYRHGRRLERIAYVDEVTGGDTIQRFYIRANELLGANNRPQYALVYSNIEKFKVLNEQFGREACDGLLCSLWQGAHADLTDQECAGRIAADNFCILAVWDGWEQMAERIQRWYELAAAHNKEGGALWMDPIIGAGVYLIGEETMPFDHMIDRAKLALKDTDQELCGRVRCAVYDDAVRRKLFREKQLEDMMEGALQKGEFMVYLQPKYAVENESIGGAEALVRWKSADEGMIYPDEFIPLFEKNGFIVQLDLYVFNEVCRAMRSWMDAGLTPVKVSVNCSRINLRLSNFLDRYKEACAKWGVPTEYMEIELTEGLVFEDVERLAQIIGEIHAAGFGCSMDDFGSGYSSLNMIRDIPVDTIKLDRVFFRTADRSPERTESVVGCILSMTKSLHMTTVAEGVEERPQVEMLKRLGCDFIQGYYFAKPMPISEFERAAFGRVVEGAVV